MLRSMYSATSGLKAHQTKMDVIGNNISNVNSIGFKKSSVNFTDMMSQTIQGASGPTGKTGGTNPMSVGLGSKVSSMNTHFTQGTFITTGRSTDLAIDGNGFFAVTDGTEIYYTRNGNFGVDAEGYLVTAAGHKVLGQSINGSGTLEPIKVPLGETQPPKKTTEFAIGNNLKGNVEAGTKVTTSVEVFDNLGGSHIIKTEFTKSTDSNKWEVSMSLDPANPLVKDWIAANKPDYDSMSDTEKQAALEEANDALLKNRNSVLVFTDQGVIDTVKTQKENGTTGDALLKPIEFSPNGTEPMKLEVDMKGITQYSSDSTVVAKGQNGNPPGMIKALTFDPNGNVYGVFTNGFSKELGTLTMATFANDEGLEVVGGSLFRKSSNSGDPIYGTANSDSKGVIGVGYLEASNVDLSNEVTDMIIVQKGYSMNAKMITVSDEMLQELINIKR